MTTTSYPAVGTNGLSENQWSVLFGDSDGIVEDYMTGGVAAFNPTTSGDLLSIGLGKVRVNGYILSIDAPESFTIATSTSTSTWFVSAVYDPTLNVARADGSADPAGPVRLTCTLGAPTLTGGKVAITLFRITRGVGQTLAAALTASLLPAAGGDLRSWVGPLVFVAAYVQDYTGFGPWPRGSRLIQYNRGGLGVVEESFRVPSGTSLVWSSKDFAPALAFPLPSDLVSRGSAPSTPQYLQLPGNMIKLRGNIKRSSGNLSTGSDVVLGTMPAGLRPLFTERFIVKAGPDDHFAEIRVNSDGTSDGKVIMSDPGFTCTWVELSGVYYRAEV